MNSLGPKIESIIRRMAADYFGARNELAVIGESAIPYLTETAESPDVLLRQMSVIALASLGEMSLASLITLARRADSDVSSLALNGLSAIGGQRAIEALREAAVAGREGLRGVAIRELGRLGDASAEILIRQRLVDKSPLVRAESLGGLCALIPNECANHAILGLQDPHWMVREAASGMLRDLTDARVVSALEMALRDNDSRVVENSIEGLVTNRSVNSIPRLMKLRWHLHSDVRARAKSAVERLSNLSTDEPSP